MSDFQLSGCVENRPIRHRFSTDELWLIIIFSIFYLNWKPTIASMSLVYRPSTCSLQMYYVKSNIMTVMLLCHSLCWSGSTASCWETGVSGRLHVTHIIAAVANASPGSLPHNKQVHLCSSRTGTAQTLSAVIGHLPYLGVPAKSSKEWIQYKSDMGCRFH